MTTSIAGQGPHERPVVPHAPAPRVKKAYTVREDDEGHCVVVFATSGVEARRLGGLGTGQFPVRQAAAAEQGRDQHDANVARHQREEAVTIVLEALIGVAAARHHFAPFLLFTTPSKAFDLAAATFSAASNAS